MVQSPRRPPISPTLMTLPRRQVVASEIFDDQSSTLWGSFVGNWTRLHASNDDSGFNNNTLTSTPTPGASLSFTFSGSQAWLYGTLDGLYTAGGEIPEYYPTADYKIDGVSANSQRPWAANISGADTVLVYFQTPKLADATHKIDITVTTANWTTPFVVDFFLVTPSYDSGVETSRGAPSSTPTQSTLPIVATQSTPAGAIAGGVVGGIAGIAILAVAMWFFLRRRSRGSQANYFEKPTPADILAGECL